MSMTGQDWVTLVLAMVIVSYSAIMICYAAYRVTERKLERDAPESNLERHNCHGRGVECVVCVHDGRRGIHASVH